jgi:hypothetical protein
MTVLRGQYYQWNILPNQFYFVSRIFSPTKILLFEIPDGFQVYQTTAQIEANYTLLDSLPQNRLWGPGAGDRSGVSLAYALTGDFLSARVDAQHQTLKAKALAPTYLRERSVLATMTISANLINPLILGGNLAAQGRTVQAHADQG